MTLPHFGCNSFRCVEESLLTIGASPLRKASGVGKVGDGALDGWGSEAFRPNSPRCYGPDLVGVEQSESDEGEHAVVAEVEALHFDDEPLLALQQKLVFEHVSEHVVQDRGRSDAAVSGRVARAAAGRRSCIAARGHRSEEHARQDRTRPFEL
jgi:hypothetical protein